MSKIYKPKNKFSQIPNSLISDPRVSLKSKGIYALLASKPDGWTYVEAALIKESSDGRDGFRSGVSELVKAGWLKKVQPIIENKFGLADWYLTDVKGVFPVNGNPADGFSVYGKSDTNNNNISNTDINNTDVSKKINKKENQNAKPKTSINTYLAGNETCPDDMYNFASVECNWSDGHIRQTFAVFVDYWRSEGKTKQDWLATWRNWCRRQKPSSSNSGRATGNAGAGTAGRGGVLDAVGEVVAARYGKCDGDGF